MKRSMAVALAGGLALTLAGRPAGANLLAYEGFDYGAAGATIQGQNGGTGWAGGWTAGGYNASIHTNYVAGASSLTYPGLLTGGKSMTTVSEPAISGLVRNFAAPLGAANTTEYFSFLARPDGALSGGTFNNYFGMYLNASTGNDMFIGKPGNGPINQFALETRGGVMQAASGVSINPQQTYLLVVRADFTASFDRFTLYVNPLVGSPEPAFGTVKNDSDVGTVSGVTLYSTGAYSLDEIRVGTTFADVTPRAGGTSVPEPGAAVCLLTGLVGLWGVTRRRRARLESRV